MVHYTISFSGSTCVLSNIKFGKDEEFKLPKLPHHDSIKYLNIKNSTIPRLTEDILGSFPNLERFEAMSIGIEEISEDAFAACQHLKHIDLTNNYIKELEPFTFNRNPSLTFLDLGENELAYLPNEIFSNLEDLYTLHLSSNKLTSVSKKLFKNFKNLKFFDLSHNQLIDVNVEALIEQTPKLTQIGLGDNDFSAQRMREILAICAEANIGCITSVGPMRSRPYEPVMVEGFVCIPDSEYDRLVAKKKIMKLEQKQEAMQKKMDLMQSSLAFLLKEHELQQAQKKPNTPPFNVVRVEELEKEFKEMFQKG